MTQPVTLLIIDDHQLVRWGVRTFLATQPDITVVGEAGSGDDALRLAAELVPDVALMDLVMPGMDGVETTRKLKQISPRTQVIVLTSFRRFWRGRCPTCSKTSARRSWRTPCVKRRAARR